MKISLLADHPGAAQSIASWYFQQWAHKDPDATLESVTKKVLSGTNRKELPIAFVVHIDNELAGVGEIKYREMSQYPNCNHWLDGVYVPAEQRGKGISTQLIQFAKDKAHELGIQELYLRCEAHNVGLYENHGFNVIKEEENKSIMKVSTFNFA